VTWLRLDDQIHRHEKIAPLSDRAWRLHVTAMLECCARLTDGKIARDMPVTWPAAPRGKALSKTIAELESKGLWELNDYGWMVHDFLDWNPSAEQVRETRKVRASAGQKGGKVKAKQKQTLKQNGSKTEAKLCPVPVPVPVPDHSLTESVGTPREPASREELTRPETDSKTHSHSETATLPRREPLALVGTPGDQVTPETKGRANSGAANTSPVSPERARSVNPGECVPCSPHSCTVADVTAALSGSQVPAWAIPDMLQKVHTHFGSDPSDVRTRKAWVKKAATWIVGDWIEGRRPTRPGEPAGTRQVVKVPLKTLDHNRFPGFEGRLR
jgi:hypothetical protein